MSVTRADLEAKLGEIQDALSGQAEQAKSKAMPVAVGAVVLLLLVAFVLGRRRGRKKTTVVEIRRV